jgi:phosphoribosyl-ATP pyrophosphohydrolase
MLTIQQDVLEFHKKFGATVGTTVKLRRRKLRRRLIKEEAKELCKAIKNNNIADAVDGACDLLYVTVGTMIEAGIDLEPFWDAVHAANMEKEGGGERDDGKVLKPEDWEPPDIGSLLQEQILAALTTDPHDHMGHRVTMTEDKRTKALKLRCTDCDLILQGVAS